MVLSNWGSEISSKLLEIKPSLRSPVSASFRRLSKFIRGFISASMNVTKLSIIFHLSFSLKDKVFSR